MNYFTFREKYSSYPVIDSRSVALTSGESGPRVRNQLFRWASRGLLLRLKRGVYALNAQDRRCELNELYVANQLYSPSYISLESALSYYGIIPERVAVVTSVSLKKTQRFKTDIGIFLYRSIMRDAFKGFRAEKTSKEGGDVLIAEPEKAIVDFCYYHQKEFKIDPQRVAVESYRFQAFNDLSADSMRMFAAMFGSREMTVIIDSVAQLIGSI